MLNQKIHSTTKKTVILLLVTIAAVVIIFLSVRNTDPRVIVMNVIKVLPLKEKIWAEKIDAAFEPVDCPTSTRVLSDAHYKGSMIDTHIHIPAIPELPFGSGDSENDRPVLGENVSMADFVCMMDYENTKKVFAFFPVYDPIKTPLTEVVKKTMEKYSDRFVPFIMPPDRDDSADGFPTVDAKTLQDMLTPYPNLFKGYGEIGLYERGDHGGPKGAPELPPDSQRLLDIYPIVRNHKLIVYFHLGRGQQESFEQVLEQNPDINFIWHGDQLIPYDDGVQNLKFIEEILSGHKNVYYGVDELYGDVWLIRPETTKEKFLEHFKDSESLLKKDLATWKGFIERHPDQVLWGTDRGVGPTWSIDPEVAITLNTYTRAFIGRLHPSVQEKFAYKNAEKLLSQ